MQLRQAAFLILLPFLHSPAAQRVIVAAFAVRRQCLLWMAPALQGLN
jgi:hypothetical protein